MWRRLAYAARYGHQPLAGLLDMSVTDINRFNQALYDWVRKEQGSSDDGGTDG